MDIVFFTEFAATALLCIYFHCFIYQINRKMKVSVNNKEVETYSTTLLQLAEELSLPPVGVAIAVDNKMIPRAAWGDYALSPGMSIVIIKAACGG